MAVSVERVNEDGVHHESIRLDHNSTHGIEDVDGIDHE